jgi:predicted nucleic acid-binding protein
MPYWADASYLIGLSDPKDQWHSVALGIHDRIGRKNPLRIHALAVAEVVTRLTKTVGVGKAEEAYFVIKDTMEIHYPFEQDLDDAMDIVVKYEGRLSLSDSLFVHLMEKKDIVLSFDSGFDGKVRRLPEP